ncbi:uncharacterized protein LOC142330740 [Lycorma delicatula]|uniref:uncharacterized protein LOC142330740 n=1 Tax=Lycorma delicatula TaxID=130591 RepID=UPI003F517D55
MRHKFPFVFIINLTALGIWVSSLEQVIIPEHLLSCYRARPTVLPQTMETLIEIIRKIELQPGFNMNITAFSNSLLHKFRVDGIERDPNVVQNMPGVVPYRTSGFQTYRQQILLKYLIPDNAAVFPINTLTENEKCNLHWLLSSTVDVWERGDEIRSCPQSNQGFLYAPLQRFGAKLSNCPEEWGIVYQEHGTFSPGTVIAGIAAALAPIRVEQVNLLSPVQQYQRPIGWQVPSLSDNAVNNTWIATLAGDLAEAVHFKSPATNEIYIGPSGTWNDTYIPTAYYFTNLDYNRIEKKGWQITDAEIIGGIDGLILSKQVSLLVNQFKSLRLSQVLEMYYSDKGLLSNNIRACNREINAGNINNEKEALLTQVENFVGVLAANVPNYITDYKFISVAAHQALDKFIPYLSDIKKKSKCVPRMAHSDKVNLNIIIDQTWTSYTTLQIVMFLCRATDVSYYGSSVTIINGQRGSLVVQAAQNTTDVFLNWRSSVTEPHDLNLPQSLITLKTTVENSIEVNKLLQNYNSQSHIALVIGYSSTITDSDHNKAKSLVSSIKSLNPDMKFIYVTSRVNSPRFVQLTALPGSQDDKIVIIDNVNNVQAFISQLQDPLSFGTRSLVAPFCKGAKGSSESKYEEYITPGQPVKYRIHPDYLCGSSGLQIKMVNWDHGDIQVCMSRTESATGVTPQCKIIKGKDEYVFSIAKPCEKHKKQVDSSQNWLETCRPIYLDISAHSTSKNCSEKECRFPDQVKFNIILQGLRCVEPYKTICSSSYTFSPDIIMIAIPLILVVFNYLV